MVHLTEEALTMLRAIQTMKVNITIEVELVRDVNPQKILLRSDTQLFL